MSPIELTAVAGLLTAVVGAIVAMRKLRPERDSLVLTQAQGAATILNDLVQTLYKEIDRQRREHEECREELHRLQEQLAARGNTGG